MVFGKGGQFSGYIVSSNRETEKKAEAVESLEQLLKRQAVEIIDLRRQLRLDKTIEQRD